MPSHLSCCTNQTVQKHFSRLLISCSMVKNTEVSHISAAQLNREAQEQTHIHTYIQTDRQTDRGQPGHTGPTALSLEVQELRLKPATHGLRGLE